MTTKQQKKYDHLKHVMVVTFKKSFWASEECKIFPNIIYSRFIGRSRNFLNVFLITFKAFIAAWVYKPKIIIFGSASVSVPFFMIFNKLRLIPRTRLIATTHIFFNDFMAQFLDRIIVFSSSQIKRHHPKIQDKYIFMPLPADGEFEMFHSVEQGDYIFSGGGDHRDFNSLIEAIKGLNVKLKIVTFSPATFDYTGELPDNCEVLWRMPRPDFLKLIAGALFVVVPLKKGRYPHGHTTIVQAQHLGKAVLSNTDASVEDYITDNQEGLLVSPGDIEGYKKAILMLITNKELRESFEKNTIERSKELTYEAFSQKLSDLCHDLL